MSYCRWSSDNWKCDIYAYESKDGYVIHVAGRRIANIDDMPQVSTTIDDTTAWLDAVRRQGKFMDEMAVHEDITLPYAGETFIEPTLEDFEARLHELSEMGYHVPVSVFVLINEEKK